MRCVVCKEATSGNEPLEHILPEGLGNTEHVLRRGVVCGRCNNYFARKVEKPFLELPTIVALRFEQAVPSKKGLVPAQNGMFLQGRCRVQAIREPHSWETKFSLPKEVVPLISNLDRGTFIFPTIPTAIEPSVIVARFVGKVGIEAFASRMENDDGLLEEMVETESLDALRHFVRQGKIMDWPISIRRIYDADSDWVGGEKAPYQIMHEFDFIVLNKNEIYFILSLFGQEIVINIGGPSLEGWHNWLDENDGLSPLHHGNNAKISMRF